MATEAQLLARVPRLPRTEAPTLPQSVRMGLNTGVHDPQVLVDPQRNHGGGLFDPRYVTVLDRDHDPLTEGTSVRRRLLTFGAQNESFRHTLNTELGGGESSPILVTALGIGAGLVSGGAGIVFSVAATAIDMQRTNQPVRARPGDAVDKIELLGKRGNSVYHWQTFVLVDPYRARANATPAQWVIHGELSEVTFR